MKNQEFSFKYPFKKYDFPPINHLCQVFVYFLQIKNNIFPVECSSVDEKWGRGGLYIVIPRLRVGGGLLTLCKLLVLYQLYYNLSPPPAPPAPFIYTCFYYLAKGLLQYIQRRQMLIYSLHLQYIHIYLSIYISD